MRPRTHPGDGGPYGEAPWGYRRRRFAPGRRQPRLLLPIIVGVIQVVGANIAVRNEPGALAVGGLGIALLVIGPAALIVRKRFPVAVLAVTLAADVAYLALGYPHGPYFLAALISLFGAVRRANRIAVWAVTGAAFVSYAVVSWKGFAALGPTVVVAVWVTVALLLAEAGKVRAEHFGQLARAAGEASRARKEQSRRQASEERLRIARELHDVLGHHLSLINVRAGVALHLLDSRPEQTLEAREALEAIKQASAEALREVRSVLATVNPDDESAPRSPAPGLASVDSLAEEARAAGHSVVLRRQGLPRPIPADVDRAAYRIVQESLTNVRRHAGPQATVTVLISYGVDRLTLRISDTGTGPEVGESTSESPGSGIAGMRIRTAALGGTLDVGADLEGGFVVVATLPLPMEDVDAVDAVEEEPTAQEAQS